MNKLPERQGRRGRDAARSHDKSWTYGKVTTFSQHELVQTHNQARLPDIQHWYFRDCPAVIGAGHLELYHRDRICGTSNDTEATTDTLLLVDDHIGAAAPGLCTGLHDGFCGRIAGLRLARVAVTLLLGQGRNVFERDGLVVIDHAATVIGQLYLFRWFGGLVNATKVTVYGNGGITSIADGGDEIARAIDEVATGEEAGVAGHPGLAVHQRNAVPV